MFRLYETPSDENFSKLAHVFAFSADSVRFFIVIYYLKIQKKKKR